MTTPPHEVAINCPKCGFWLERSYWNQSAFQPCSHCQTQLRLLVFPAAVEAPAEPALNPNSSAGEATCYNHANKQAHVACAMCGRFLCIVCDVEFRGDHWCPACLKQQAEGNADPLFQRVKMRFDSLALILVTLPAILIYPTILTAPAALFLSIRYWNEDRGFLPRSGLRKYIAVTLALVEIAAWATAFYFLVYYWSFITKRRP